MTPLLPWRPAILSPTDSLRFDGDVDLDQLDARPAAARRPSAAAATRSSLTRCSTSMYESVLRSMLADRLGQLLVLDRQPQDLLPGQRLEQPRR